jgi:predicted phosphodiesterase
VRVLVLGDTHGDSKWCVEVTRLAGEQGVERILQVGDFGYWPKIQWDLVAGQRVMWAERFLSDIARACVTYGVIEWIVLDGNHDDHRSLQAVLRRRQPDDDGLVELGRYVRYSPRGNSFKLAGVSFGTLGGAASIDAYLEEWGVEFDKEPYTRGYDWFPELEQPSMSDVDRLPESVDVLLTHEAPMEIDLSHLNGFPNLCIPPEVQRISDIARHIVSAALRATSPQLLIHGHWHGRNRVRLERRHMCCEVVGLASNSRRRGRDERSFLILDLPDLTIKAVTPVVADAST